MVLTSKRLILYFNPRSHERSDCYSNISLTFSSYFNPRSHERSDSNGLMMFDDTLISIHAPTRGATILCNHRGLVFGFQSTLPREERLSFPCNISFHLIFQSTLPREERQTMRKLTIAELNFNPRSHERSDPMVKKFLLMKMISIHAPTRGATCNSIRPLCIYEFQSTLPREERHHRCLFYVSNVLFQSTLPREERHPV